MNFLVDAQLPRLLAIRLAELGHPARHTLDLPCGNRSADHDIAAMADRQDAVVVTKDADFIHPSRAAKDYRKGIVSWKKSPPRGLSCMKAATRDWIAKAEHDHLAAVDLARRRKIPLHDMVCFHCQQAAEKYLKASPEERSIHFPKTHDLESLLPPLDPHFRHPLPLTPPKKAEFMQNH